MDEGNVSEDGQSFNERKEFCQTVATQPAMLNDGSIGVVLEMNDFQQYIEYGNYSQFSLFDDVVKRNREEKSAGKRESNTMSRTSFI